MTLDAARLERFAPLDQRISALFKDFENSDWGIVEKAARELGRLSLEPGHPDKEALRGIFNLGSGVPSEVGVGDPP